MTETQFLKLLVSLYDKDFCVTTDEINKTNLISDMDMQFYLNILTKNGFVTVSGYSTIYVTPYGRESLMVSGKVKRFLSMLGTTAVKEAVTLVIGIILGYLL